MLAMVIPSKQHSHFLRHLVIKQRGEKGKYCWKTETKRWPKTWVTTTNNCRLLHFYYVSSFVFSLLWLCSYVFCLQTLPSFPFFFFPFNNREYAWKREALLIKCHHATISFPQFSSLSVFGVCAPVEHVFGLVREYEHMVGHLHLIFPHSWIQWLTKANFTCSSCWPNSGQRFLPRLLLCIPNWPLCSTCSHTHTLHQSERD